MLMDHAKSHPSCNYVTRAHLTGHLRAYQERMAQLVSLRTTRDHAVLIVSRMLWKFSGGGPRACNVFFSGREAKGHRFDGLREGFPSVNLAHLDLAGCDQRAERHGHAAMI